MENITQLSITDLALLRNIIDLAAKRGTFQASEMKSVGEVYDKLTGFLDSVVKQAEAEQAAAAQQGEAND